jgi:tripartite-type tricarboxylate transporter receptor subunit TctC
MLALKKKISALLAMGLGLMFTTAAVSQTVEELYKGKTLKFVVAAAPGGGADLYARLVSKHFSRFIPGNPAIVVQNVPGAGGITAASQLMNNPIKDGSVFALLQRNNLVEPLVSERRSGFDPRKLKWLGSLNKDTYVIISWHTSGVKSLEDVKSKELLLGNTGGGNENVTFPEMLNKTLGTKFKLVRGYPGSHDVALAIERGEVQGRAVTWTTLIGEHLNWINEKKINIIAQLGLGRNPDVGDIPNATEFVTNEGDRILYDFMFSPLEAGRPFAMPPETPPAVVDALRKAFVDMANNKKFGDELKARGGSVELLNGEDTQALINKLFETPEPTLVRARELLKSIQQ